MVTNGSHASYACVRSGDDVVKSWSDRATNVLVGRSRPAYETWIRPLQQCLALLGTRPDSTDPIVCRAIAGDLSVMPLEGHPSFDLYRIDGGFSTTVIIATVPLEPAPIVRAVQPTVFTPLRQRLATFDLEVVTANVGFTVGRETSRGEPLDRILGDAVAEVASFTSNTPNSSISVGEKKGSSK